VNATGRPPSKAATATAWYVYGVVPAEAFDALRDDFPGVADAGVRIVSEGGFGAVVSEVPLAQFDDEALASNLRDAVWLESGVRAHDAVLAAFVDDGSVVPFRFGTIYRSEERVRAMLVEQRGLADALNTVRGRVELGVKGFFAQDVEASADAPEKGELSPGRLYLEQKQEARRATEEQEAFLARLADESHARLAHIAEDSRANPLQPPEVSGRDQAMFLNGAYLVARPKEEDFRGAVEALEDEFRADGVGFELTGPWPPYNFVEVDS
jgi:Gas vesicle synthesis protein GvpL/GvpF